MRDTKRKASKRRVTHVFGRIDPELHERFKQLCERERRTQRSQLEIIITEYLEAHGYQ